VNLAEGFIGHGTEEREATVGLLLEVVIAAIGGGHDGAYAMVALDSEAGRDACRAVGYSSVQLQRRIVAMRGDGAQRERFTRQFLTLLEEREQVAA
jgi:hypothetical protein